MKKTTTALLVLCAAACGDEFDAELGDTAGAVTPGVSWTLSQYQIFENPSTFFQESGWDRTSNLNGFRPHDVATDGTHMYSVGQNWIPKWRIEKRLLSSGTRDGEVIGADGTKAATAIAINAGHMFVVGTTNSDQLRVEKRFLDADMPLDRTFSNQGVLLATNDFEARDIVIDSTFMYIVGHRNHRWRMEARRLSSGVLVWSKESSSFESTHANGVVLDDEFMYVVGSGKNPILRNWRIEKRALSDGNFASGFGTGGVIEGTSFTQNYAAQAVALAGDTLLVAGDRANNFFIRHYAKDSGTLLRNVYGATLSDEPTSLVVDGDHYYVGGDDDNGDSRLEKRSLATGALDTSFGTNGVITGNSASVEVRALAIDVDSVFAVGVNNRAARSQRFFLADGGTSTRNTLARLGDPLAGPNSRADHHGGGHFRLRVKLRADGADIDPGDDDFLLKVALKDGDHCADIASSAWNIIYPDWGVIRMRNIIGAPNGQRAWVSQIDPEAQTYNESTGFTTGRPMFDGSTGVFDFSLTSVGAAAGDTYCFKVTDHDGNDLVYDVYPEYVPNPHPMLSGATISCRSFGGTGAIPTGTPNRFDRFNVNLTEYPDAVCNDGSAASLYIRRGSDHPDKWVLYMLGGGGCTDGQHCGDRWCGRADNFSATQMSTLGDPAGASPSGILGNHVRNPFQGWTTVLMKYCSSDSWSGQARGRQIDWFDPATSSTVSVTMQIMGHRVVEGMLDTLRHKFSQVVINQDGAQTLVPNLDNAEEILLAGSSGGGGGATRHVDWLAAHAAPHGTVVRGMFDASTHVDRSSPDLDWSSTTICSARNICSYADSLTERQDILDNFREGFSDESCLATTPDVRRCTDNHFITKNHITTPYLVWEDQTDNLHVRNFFNTEFTLSGAFAPPGGILLDDETDPAQLLIYTQLVEADMNEFTNIMATGLEAPAMTTNPAVFNPRCGFHTAIDVNARAFVRVNAANLTMTNIWNNWVSGGAPTSFFASLGGAAMCAFP